MKEITKEQEEKLQKMKETNENDTLYICQKCNEKLLGMKRVREHLNKYNHYEYKNPNHMGVIGFL